MPVEVRNVVEPALVRHLQDRFRRLAQPFVDVANAHCVQAFNERYPVILLEKFVERRHRHVGKKSDVVQANCFIKVLRDVLRDFLNRSGESN